MYLLYVDESGDTGMVNSPTNYFILTGVVIHETSWRGVLADLVIFRQNLKATKGLKMKEEIHAVEFINKPGPLVRIPRNDRLDILKKCIDWAKNRTDISIVTIAVNKTTKPATYDVFEAAWQALIQRFENTIQHQNFPGAHRAQRGMIIADNTDQIKLTKLLRKMRHFNMVPSQSGYTTGPRNLKLQYIIEDPFFKDSSKSFIHQLIDVIAYMARQIFEPNSYMRRKGGVTFYSRLLPAINPHTTRSHSLHIRVL